MASDNYMFRRIMVAIALLPTKHTQNTQKHRASASQVI